MAAPVSEYIPYCGLPPVPGELWTSWQLDPILLISLAALAGAYALGVWRLAHRPQDKSDEGSATRGQQACFFTGWAVLTLALVSPLCSLSVSLFSARVGQHMILLLIAAPLLMLGRPEIVAARAWPTSSPTLRHLGRALASPAAAWGVFAVFLWMWHMPRPYAATFESDLVYWTMHITLIGSAVLLWRLMLASGPAGWLPRLFAGFTTLMHMSLLGAIITLAPRLLYSPHVMTAQTWGLSPLEDQQLGGLLMWVPGCSVLILAAIAQVAVLFRSIEARQSTPSDRKPV